MLEPLAIPDDLEFRLGITFTTAAELSRATTLIQDASAAVRNYTRQQITASTDTAILESTTEQWLYLPERPVTAVVSVLAGAAPLTAGMWHLQNDALYRYDGWGSRFYGSSSVWNQPDTIVIEYTHGFVEIPEDVVRVVCKLAESSWVNPQRLRTATAGGVTVSIDSGSVGIGSLDEDDKRTLDAYRRQRRSVVLSAGVL